MKCGEIWARQDTDLGLGAAGTRAVEFGEVRWPEVNVATSSTARISAGPADSSEYATSAPTTTSSEVSGAAIPERSISETSRAWTAEHHRGTGVQRGFGRGRGDLALFVAHAVPRQRGEVVGDGQGLHAEQVAQMLTERWAADSVSPARKAGAARLAMCRVRYVAICPSVPIRARP